MPNFQFEKYFTLGHTELDNEHRELIRQIAESCDSGNFGSMFSAIVKHYQAEEQFMRTARYPEEKLQAHINQHKRDLYNIQRLVKDDTLSRCNRIKTVLLAHIGGYDAYFHQWYKNNQAVEAE